jgi:hypothetical protein
MVPLASVIGVGAYDSIGGHNGVNSARKQHSIVALLCIKKYMVPTT